MPNISDKYVLNQHELNNWGQLSQNHWKKNKYRANSKWVDPLIFPLRAYLSLTTLKFTDNKNWLLFAKISPSTVWFYNFSSLDTIKLGVFLTKF